MGWTLFFMFIVLKLPIAGLGYICWWSVKQEPEPTSDDGGGNDREHPRRRPHPPNPRPRRPRRGPHGDPAPLPPARTRSVLTARGRELHR